MRGRSQGLRLSPAARKPESWPKGLTYEHLPQGHRREHIEARGGLHKPQKRRYLTANILITACLQSHRSYSGCRTDISNISSRNPVKQ